MPVEKLHHYAGKIDPIRVRCYDVTMLQLDGRTSAGRTLHRLWLFRFVGTLSVGHCGGKYKDVIVAPTIRRANHVARNLNLISKRMNNQF